MKSIKRQDFLNVANQYNDYIGKVKKEGFFTYFTLYNHDESDFIDIEYNLLRHYILVSHETDYKLYNINDLPIFIDNFLKNGIN